ncbi:hypothetical protein B0H17DRAFT_505588 [Mycena rosella]|uniref:F-box domain-containing protein n=1 Tax=Mycena rosella TaxID=1033263 RepID=A0AAD7GKE5_MYCRO|nr:hypothetical protein B0H17DRAFT_505588 [Mycena rosella]
MSVSNCPECGAFSAALRVNCNATPGIRHHTLLTTNEPPESSDVAFIQSVALTTGARLSLLDKEITRRRNLLQQLEEERASLSVYHAQNTVIISPLRRIPPELLAEIFSWTLPSVLEARTRARLDTVHSPRVLTHISSLWRAVALSTSSL